MGIFGLIGLFVVSFIALSVLGPIGWAIWGAFVLWTLLTE